MRRGDIITASVPGDYGKPRPALIVQSNAVTGTESVLIALITSVLRDAPTIRLTVQPLPGNGLRTASQIMADKIMTIPRAKCGQVIGRLDDGSIVALNHMLSVVLGLAD
jgi:mRNA interferase MazF